MNPNTQIIKAMSRGCLAEMREVIDLVDDRDHGRVIYAELLRLARKLADKHKFDMRREMREESVASLL